MDRRWAEVTGPRDDPIRPMGTAYKPLSGHGDLAKNGRLFASLIPHFSPRFTFPTIIISALASARLSQQAQNFNRPDWQTAKMVR